MQQSSPMRRLFVLEGLDPRFTDILGSRLKIPPSVFIAQASGPGSIDITDADGYLHDSSQYWNVQVQQLHRLAEGFYTHAGSFWKENVTPKRRAGTFVKRPFSWSFMTHLVSFWSTKYDEESWDAVILVDPEWEATVYEHIKTKTRMPILNNPNFDVQHDEKSLPIAPHIGMDALSSDPSTWSTNTKTRPPLMSIRLRLRDLYARFPHGATADPGSATGFCGGVVFSLWELTIRAVEWRYIHLWDEEMSRSFNHADDPWRRDDFQKMSDQQLVSRRLKKDFYDVCRKLGVTNDSTAVGGGGGGGGHHKGRSWGWLLERITVLDEQIGDMIMVYGQRSSVQESRIANSQARSVGRLTALATVLVPFTLTAGIFSMSDEFAAGQKFFWVFWAVAIPLATVLLVWVFLVKRSPTQLLEALVGLLRRSLQAILRKVREARRGRGRKGELPTWRGKEKE